MATFTNFESIEAWAKARELTKEIYAISATGSFSRDFALRDQIRRASISVMSNIAEGFERGGTREFNQFLSIAKGSVGEVKSQVFVAMDQHYIDSEQAERLLGQATEIGRMIGGLMKYLSKTPIKGSKYK